MSDLRIERKLYIVDRLSAHLERFLRLSTAAFRECYPERQVNNIYFDTKLKKSFWENVEGQQYKAKMRVRWYGPLSQRNAKAQLEEKKKLGRAGMKTTTLLYPFEFGVANWSENITNSLSCSDLSEAQRSSLLLREPTLINHYFRRYFVSLSGKIRITVDRDLCFLSPETGTRNTLWPRTNKKHRVLEIKYAIEDEAESKAVFEQLPYRPVRHSKYVTGVAVGRGINNILYPEVYAGY